MNRKAFLACVLMCVILTGCETAKKISEVIKNPDIQVGSLKEQPSEITVTLLTEPDTNTNAEGESAAVDVQLVYLTDDSKLLAADYDQIPEVKRALHTVLSPRAVNLPLHLRDGIWQADIHDTELLQSATFVLAVAANMPVDQIQRQFIQQSKISSPEKIRNMVSVQIPGIPLRALMVAPRQLPYHSGFSYFELDKSGQAWTEMAAAGAVALHVSGSFPDLNMQLWAIRG